MRASVIKFLESLQITPRDGSLYEEALRHSSFVNENAERDLASSERLEFLGDAVLQLIITEYLYKNYPDMPEGDLTRARAAVVSTPTLSRRGAELGLGEALVLGRGEEATGGRKRPSVIENAFEALVAALYLDRGLEEARHFVLQTLKEDIALAVSGSYTSDWKTLLQEHLQRQRILPTYSVIAEEGPDHNKTFEVVVMANGFEIGKGRGQSKKEAEQAAARMAMEIVKSETDLARLTI